MPLTLVPFLKFHSRWRTTKKRLQESAEDDKPPFFCAHQAGILNTEASISNLYRQGKERSQEVGGLRKLDCG